MTTKVVHLFFPGPLGGAEKVLLSALPRLSDVKSIKTKLWLVKESRSPSAITDFLDQLYDGISHSVFECNKILDLSLMRKLKDELTGDEIIHAHGLKATFYARLIKKYNNKLIITHHGHTSHTLKVRIYEWIQERIMKKADQVISVSKSMQDQLLELSIKSSLVENPLSLKRLELKMESTANPDILKLVVVGRLSPEKGINILLDAITDIENIELTIVGDGQEKTNLARIVKENNIENKVQFVGFQKEILPYLSESDCLVMPSLREGLPMTLIEAMCFGLPVIGSKVGGLKYLVQENGILVSPNNSKELKSAINIFIENSKEFKINAKEKSETFQKRFSVETWVKNTVNIYKNVSNQR